MADNVAAMVRLVLVTDDRLVAGAISWRSPWRRSVAA